MINKITLILTSELINPLGEINCSLIFNIINQSKPSNRAITGLNLIKQIYI